MGLVSRLNRDSYIPLGSTKTRIQTTSSEVVFLFCWRLGQGESLAGSSHADGVDEKASKEYFNGGAWRLNLQQGSAPASELRQQVKTRFNVK